MNVPNIKFDGNVSSGSRADTDGQTDVTKLTGAFLDYANAPTNHSNHVLWRRDCRVQREPYEILKYSVCVCVWQNGKFLKFAACGTNNGALNGYVAKPVNLSVHDPYELSS